MGKCSLRILFDSEESSLESQANLGGSRKSRFLFFFYLQVEIPGLNSLLC